MKEFLNKLGGLYGLISIIALLTGGLLGINSHAETIVKKEIKPVEKRLRVVETSNKETKENFEKLIVALIEKQDLTIDILYEMDEKAFLKAKQERKAKYGK